MEIFKPPAFDEAEKEASENRIDQDFGPSDATAKHGRAEKFEDEILSEKSRPRPKKRNFRDFSSEEFVAEGTLLTNVEEYSRKIREDAEYHAMKVRNEVDLIKSEIELELANALIKKREAEEEGKKIIQAAEDSRDDIVKKGTEEGFKAGFDEGFKKFEEENKKNTENILVLLREMQQLRLDLLQKYEQVFLDLCLLVAEKVVHKRLVSDQDIILEMIKSNLARFEGMGNITVTLNPTEIEFLSRHQEEIQSFLEAKQEFKLKKDPNLSPASPKIESDFSAIDLDIQKQFTDLRKVFQNLIDDRRGLFKLAEDLG